MNEQGERAAVELVRAGHAEVDALFRSLRDEQLDRPIFTGEGPGWRVRDMIAHYAYWQTVAARCAEKMASGQMPGPEDRMRSYLGITDEFDELNDANFRAWRERGTAEALAELQRANSRLIAAMERLPDEQLLTGNGPEDFHRFLWQPGVNHLRQHREHIDAALQKAAS